MPLSPSNRSFYHVLIERNLGLFFLVLGSQVRQTNSYDHKTLKKELFWKFILQHTFHAQIDMNSLIDVSYGILYVAVQIEFDANVKPWTELKKFTCFRPFKSLVMFNWKCLSFFLTGVWREVIVKGIDHYLPKKFIGLPGLLSCWLESVRLSFWQ